MSPRSMKLAVALALGLLPGASFAQTVEEAIISQLSQQGFTNISVNRTLLGRTRILATSADLRREIVFNPTTGVIIRDYWEDLDDDDDDDDDERRLLTPPRPSSGGSGTASSPASSDDDDDDGGGVAPSPDDDDDRDDNDDDRNQDRDDDDDDDRNDDDDDDD